MNNMSVWKQLWLYYDAKFNLEHFAPVAFVAVALALIALLPEASFAQTDPNPIANAVCKVVQELNGPVGRGIAMVAVIFLGFSLFMGKVSWGLAISLGIGIAAIFGAGDIVKLMGGKESNCQ